MPTNPPATLTRILRRGLCRPSALWKKSSEENSMILITHDARNWLVSSENFFLSSKTGTKASIFRDELLEQSRKEYPDRYEEDSSLALDQCLRNYLDRRESNTGSEASEFFRGWANGKGQHGWPWCFWPNTQFEISFQSRFFLFNGRFSSIP